MKNRRDRGFSLREIGKPPMCRKAAEATPDAKLDGALDGIEEREEGVNVPDFSMSRISPGFLVRSMVTEFGHRPPVVIPLPSKSNAGKVLYQSLDNLNLRANVVFTLILWAVISAHPWIIISIKWLFVPTRRSAIELLPEQDGGHALAISWLSYAGRAVVGGFALIGGVLWDVSGRTRSALWGSIS